MNPNNDNRDNQERDDQERDQQQRGVQGGAGPDGTNPSEIAPMTGGDAPPFETTVDELRRRVSALEQSLQGAEDRFLRSQAELENSRKRMRREMEDERRYACLPLIRDMLTVMDNLNRALSSSQSSSTEEAPLLTGVRMVANEFQSVLEKSNCRRIPAEGMPFDPNFHSAIGQIPTKDHSPGTVVRVVLDGYQLHDRVVRPAQVLVATAPVETAATGRTNEKTR
jgi:molecular chaperone GrpE